MEKETREWKGKRAWGRKMSGRRRRRRRRKEEGREEEEEGHEGSTEGTKVPDGGCTTSNSPQCQHGRNPQRRDLSNMIINLFPLFYPII